VPPEEIAVISAYSAQVRLLVSKSPDPLVEIDSVDGFQGREKELVIVSLVRSNMEGEMGFLADTRRMNVAMTRAKKRLVVIGDGATLASLDFYRQFMDYAESIGANKSIWEYEKHFYRSLISTNVTADASFLTMPPSPSATNTRSASSAATARASPHSAAF
jgi:superfamily I DNA and/or RNA helicase